MKHTTSESDVTSLATTSPPRTPKSPKQRRPAYYVRSPSRDSSSHDGYGDNDKTSSTSQHTTPVYNSPLESPSHPSSTGRHSRISSSVVTRYSGFLRSASSPATAATTRKPQRRHDCREVDVIDEEAAAYDEEHDVEEVELPSALACCFSVLVLLFVMVCLIVWGAARHSKPSVVVKSLTVHNFYVGEGTDITGVPTKLVTLNCSVTVNVHNPSTMFGIHVSSVFTRLMYQEISVADGRFDKFYQGRSSHHVASVVLHGEKTPLYGAGATLNLFNTGGTVPLMLDMAVRTRGYVIGKLVRVTHKRHVKCLAVIDSGSSKPVRFRQSACSYS